LQTILEAMFITKMSANKTAKAKALSLMLKQAELETKALEYEAYHLFATNTNIENILLKRQAKPVNGKVMIKWVNNG
jgi:predicted secreted acid phosphatase